VHAPETVAGAGSPYLAPELYDAVHAPYRADIDFYVRAAQAARGAVLEAACGTGRVLLPTLEAGVDIEGFDREPKMLDVLKRKAQALGLSPCVYAADLREFALPRRYALVTIPLRSFQHLLTTEDQLEALGRLHDHLEPGGRLLFNVFCPSWEFIQEHDGEPHPIRELAHPETGLPVALYDTRRYDRVHQIVSIEREVVADPGGHAAHTQRYAFALRWTFRFEMELLLEAAGFERWQVTGGFDGGPAAQDGEEMVWTAWRA
jgi:SAM-dependent methyltransferase